MSTGRHKALDALRRRARFDASLAPIVERLDRTDEPREPDEIEDDRLRLVFACCHPLLAREAQVALTLREVCGLTTEEIARALLTSGATIAQRIVRAKAKLREARVSYQVPSRAELPARLDAVLHVIYVVFNEGYLATSGTDLVRVDLSVEAVRLARLLVELCPEPEAEGLLALVLLHDARRAARSGPDGELVLIEDQDRSVWNRAQIAEGAAYVTLAIASRRYGAYTLQAAIAAVHAERRARKRRIGRRSSRCTTCSSLRRRRLSSSSIARCGRDARRIRGRSRAHRHAPRGGEVQGYHLAHAARADLCRRLGRDGAARESHERALEPSRLRSGRGSFCGRV